MVGLQKIDEGRRHILRPKRHIHWQAVVAALAFLAPIFAVLYWLTIPRGTWLGVVNAQVVVMLIYAWAAIGAHRSAIWVGPDGITERGFFGRTTTTPLGEIGSVVWLELYRSDAIDTNAQLFVTGLDGGAVLRMRGQFWSRSAMEMVVDELDAPVVRIPDPLTLTELNRLRPELLYWFERRPIKRPA